MIKPDQIEQAATFVADAGRKATEKILQQINGDAQAELFDIQRLLADSARLEATIAEVVRTEVLAVALGVVRGTKLLSVGKKTVIAATTGERTIARANKTFPSYIEPTFKKWGCDVTAEARQETPAEIYEMTEDADFRRLFGAFGVKLDELCLTQDQIIEFVETHPEWLLKFGYATFFLFKAGGEFFVASVTTYHEGPAAGVFRYSGGDVWRAGVHLRVVVPKAAARAGVK